MAINYEYDSECEVLIKIPREGAPLIIKKRQPYWHELEAEDELYARAIWLGQGCWESLASISEEEARRVLSKWGCTADE